MRITASHIVTWVQEHATEAQVKLPLWIRKLCYQPGTTRELAFPAGDSTYRPGWDGKLESDSGTPWIPQGKSCWEIGCGQDIDGKANGDYRKRTEQTAPTQRAETSFVFVTPRRWPNKEAWIAERRNEKKWAEVRALDADDIEQWLEQNPAVSLQFAEYLGLSGPGVESLERYWSRWSSQCEPRITQAAFFADRTETKSRLLALSNETEQNGGLITLRADSIEEAAAFAAASHLEHPDLASQALVVTAIDGWQYVAKNPSLRIAIAIAANSEVAAKAPRRNGLLVIVPHATGNTNRQAQELVLERPGIYEFEKALIAIGLEESDARRDARNCGRSWSALRRHRAINQAVRHPPWLDAPQTASLALVCLLGAWNEAKEADKKIVERLANRPYAAIETDLRHLALVDDAPLLHIGSVWKAKSPLELLDLFGARISSDQVDRFFQIAEELLSRTDPQLALPVTERWAAQVYGKVHPESGFLVKSLCDALIKLAVRGPDISELRSQHIEGRVTRLIDNLLNGADKCRWLSLASYLPALAEAAPNTFLGAVESSLEMADAPVTQLILETSDGQLDGCCWHSGLLWALETLGWAPKWMPRVAMLLARLTEVPYNNRWANTPANSLVGLFRAWYPMTTADVSARIAVLDTLAQRSPAVAFDLCHALIRRGPQMAMPSAQPQWRDDNAGHERNVPWDDQRDMYLAAWERMLKLSEGQADRIARLIENIDLLDKGEAARVFELIRPFTLPGARDEDRVVLQASVREPLYRHYNLKKSRPVRLELLPNIETLYRELAPADPVPRHLWLFTNYRPHLPMPFERDTESKIDFAAKARAAALADIIEAAGSAGVQSLIDNGAQPQLVGAAMAKRPEDFATWPSWIMQAGGDFLLSTPMGRCIAGLLTGLPPPQLQPILKDVLQAGEELGWDAERKARFLALAPPIRATWDLAAAGGDETDAAYWACVPLSSWGLDWENDAPYALQRLKDARRPRTALLCGIHKLKQITPSLLFEFLQSFARGDEVEGPQLELWDIQEIVQHLEQAEGMETQELVRLEFALFPALSYAGHTEIKALFESLTSDPQIFCELVSLVYKHEHGEEEPVAEGLKDAISNAWEVLEACTRLPGTQEDGSIDPNAFNLFVDGARERCRQAGRSKMGDYVLGEILAHAPADEDGAWPCLPVRELLDRVEMEKMRRGFQLGVFNKRGVTSRGPWDGGEQERELAAHFRSLAERVQYTHLRVATVLEALADHYEHDEAARHDYEASLNKEHY